MKKRKLSAVKKKAAEDKKSTVVTDLKYMIFRAVVICGLSVFMGLSYTGLRSVMGMDKNEVPAVTAETQAVSEPVQAITPVNTYVIPRQHIKLFEEVSSKESIPKIHLEEAKVLYESGKAMFIDARSQGEYAHSHIPGSVFISAGESPDKIKERNLDKNLVYVTYCHGAGCHLSDKTAFNMYDAGYRKLAIFFGGWPEWTQAQMPVEQYQPPAEYEHLFKEAESAGKVKDITLEEAKFLYDNGLANFIDVDYTDKFNEIRIDRAMSMPLDKIDEMLPGYSGYLAQKPSVIYCHGSGGKSKKAVEKLYKAGNKKILRFTGAIDKWEKAGYPLYKKQ